MLNDARLRRMMCTDSGAVMHNASRRVMISAFGGKLYQNFYLFWAFAVGHYRFLQFILN